MGTFVLKVNHGDKDERYMAIHDINVELQKDESSVRVDANLEMKICEAIFKRLQVETINDVQSIAVKWYIHPLFFY